MTDGDLKKIESQLAHPVPDVYRQFMIAHGEELRKAKEAMPRRAMIYRDAGDVIKNNRFAREHADDVFPIGPKDTPFAESYFMIGDNGGGDYWFIKRESPESGVWFYECESHEVSKANKSLDDYLDEVRKAMRKQEKQR